MGPFDRDDRLEEVVDEFQPDIIWEDFNLNQVQEPMRLQFLAYYYNAALSWGKEVVATYKDGFDNKGEVYDYERGGAGDITNPYWLTDDAAASLHRKGKRGRVRERRDELFDATRSALCRLE